MLDLLVTLAFTAMGVFQAQASITLPANCDRNATVTSGDCNTISIKYNVSTYQLFEANVGIIDSFCSNLYPGMVVCLGLTGQDCKTTYVVQSGDTCDEIADEHSIPLSTLLANNPNVNSGGTNIYPNEVLCVSSTIYPYNTTQSS